MNKKLIQQLSDGEIAVKNDGTIEWLQRVIKEAFPNDDIPSMFVWDYYFKSDNEDEFWGDSSTTLPVYSVKDFFIEGEQEKTFPRVMLVSNYDTIKSAIKRVVFMKKNGQYLAWCLSTTLEEADKEIDINSWHYAWEVEEQTFPITITEEIYNELTNEQKELINQITQTK